MLSGLYIKLIAAAVIVAAVLGAVWYVNDLQDQVSDLTTKNTLLTDKLKTQNDAIETWKAEADKRVAESAEAVAAAKAETAKAKGKATIIYKTKPSTPGDACKSALDLVNGAAK
jgi:hypothetical protein